MEALGKVAKECAITRVRKPDGRSSRFLGDEQAERKGNFACRSWQRGRFAPSRRDSSAIARKYGLCFAGPFPGFGCDWARLSAAALRRMVDALDEGSTEIMLHPGICDAELVRSGTRLREHRETELEALLDPGVRSALNERGDSLNQLSRVKLELCANTQKCPHVISLVVPFHDEQQSVRELHRQLSEIMTGRFDPVEFVYVDDQSSDATPQILAEIARRDPRVAVLRLKRNYGQTTALAAGFDYASGDVIIIRWTATCSTILPTFPRCSKLWTPPAATSSAAGGKSAWTILFCAGCLRAWPTG